MKKINKCDRRDQIHHDVYDYADVENEHAQLILY